MNAISFVVGSCFFDRAALALYAAFLLLPSLVNASTVTVAGIAYAGDAKNIESRFKYSKRYEQALIAKGSDINAELRRALAGHRYPFDLNVTENAESKGDEVLLTALTVTDETVSEELFGAIHKLFLQIRGQALIFDFKSQKVRRTYPLSFAYLDALDHTPTDLEIDQRIAVLYEGTQGKQGILGRYAEALVGASLPYSGELFLQVTKVFIDPEAAPAIPPKLSAIQGAAESWLADQFGEALNSKAGVPLFPYAKGYAIGNVMAIRLANADYNLKIDPPDWAITAELTGVKKVKFSESAVGSSYIYASYVTVRIFEEGGTKVVLDAQFKNGEVKVVPATQSYTEDVSAYGDSIRGLFDKLGKTLGGQNLPWLKSAAITPDIDKQLVATRGLLQKCK